MNRTFSPTSKSRSSVSVTRATKPRTTSVSRKNQSLSLEESDNFAPMRRLRIVQIGFLVLFTIIVLRLGHLQIVRSAELRTKATNLYVRNEVNKAQRGEIMVLDKGATQPYIVATSVLRNSVIVNPYQLIDSKSAAASLAPILNIPVAEIEEKIFDKSKRYVVLKRYISDEESDKIKALELDGVQLESQPMRYYPEKNFLSQALGFVTKTADAPEGKYGLEGKFNSLLQGTDGRTNQEKDASGTWIFGAKREIQPVVNGESLVLTVDKSIQLKAQEVLKKTVEFHKADSGSVVILNPKTGAVVTMANFPTFDGNEYNKVTDASVYNNIATMGNYEPGSVFKPITMAAGIDAGKVTPNSTFTDPGAMTIDDFTIKNSDNKAHGVQTMTQVLEKSLNTGMIHVENTLGNNLFASYLNRFGFGRETGIELSEGSGDLANLASNIRVNFATASFGQGITVTPIQLAQAYTALANQGKMMRPYIIDSRIKADGTVVKTEAQVSNQVISSQTASQVGAMLVSVVEKGHGKKAAVSGYYIGGKTGTAQVPRKDGRGYETNNNIGTFIGYGPIENPAFVMLVRINHPRTVAFAESSAAPAFGEIAQFILNYYGIAPTRPLNK